MLQGKCETYDAWSDEMSKGTVSDDAPEVKLDGT